MRSRSLAAACLCFVAAVVRGAPTTPDQPPAARDPLPSWNEGAPRTAITDFVARVTKQGSPDFVRPEERIAVFDNDGTLWCEQPVYFQLFFAADRVRALAPDHPEWKDKDPFKSVLAGDLKSALAGGDKAVLELIAATHAGVTTDEFGSLVREWIARAEHPTYRKPLLQCTYAPMRELLDYLRANEFKTFIVSGGGIEFMRPWTERVYGIPPEQVIGSSAKLTYEVKDGTPVLVKLPEVGSIDDGPGKPVNISLHIGRRPILAFGNSDGDFQMLEWTTAGAGPRLALLVHHDDAQREVAYDRDSHIGKLDKGLDAAASRGWVVVSMKRDWERVFSFEK